jgi:hypothetical protein
MRKQFMAMAAAGLFVAGRALAGSLDPTNVPGPTMHTLEEIYQKIDNLAIVTNVIMYSAAVPKTGQTNSYQTGDDGAYQKGVAWPNPRFTIQADTNCVLDNLTGLIWARNANLAGTMNWSNAISYCEALNYGGQTDWRLPNLREQLSLVDYTQLNPSLPAGHPFTGVQSDSYWSSMSYANDTNVAWGVYMGYGPLHYDYKSSDYFFVWPVRGGQ